MSHTVLFLVSTHGKTVLLMYCCTSICLVYVHLKSFYTLFLLKLCLLIPK